MHQNAAEIIGHIQLAQSTYKLQLICPEIAAAIRPGQFVMLRIAGQSDPLLGRPFALYDTILDQTEIPIGIEIVYLVVGKMTGLLQTMKAGEFLEIWGPLGKPFLTIDSPDEVQLVAGGIGQTPFLAYIRELLGQRGFSGESARKRTSRVTLYYGARTSAYLAGVEEFRSIGAEVRVATDDGSEGYRGFVTQLLAEQGERFPLVGCGPELMLRSLRKLALEWRVPCQVSLETPMACGIGICFSCVTKVIQPDGGWDFKRVCVDGPAFDAAHLAMD